jgi:hypothetical protein
MTPMIPEIKTCTAFIGDRRLAFGPAATVAVAVKHELESDTGALVLVFEDDTGRPVDFDLRGTDDDIRARLVEPSSKAETEAEAEIARGRGRPKLGVVAREVTLLPRHWAWLNAQPGGASVALRKLVEGARTVQRGGDQVRLAQEAVGRLMTALGGDLAGYEEATRALYKRDGERFAGLVEDWPQDVREHVLKVAAPVFETTPSA